MIGHITIGSSGILSSLPMTSSPVTEPFQLPEDVIGEIIEFIDGNTLYNMSISSDQFNKLARKVRQPTVGSYLSLHECTSYNKDMLLSDITATIHVTGFTTLFREKTHKPHVMEFIKTKKLKKCDVLRDTKNALALACAFGDVHVVSQILKQSISLDYFRCNYFVQSATIYGHLDILKILVDGYGIRAPEKDCYENGIALVEAARSKRLSVVTYLVEKYGADPSHQEYCAFRIACELGAVDIVKYLYGTGKIETKIIQYELFGQACCSGHVEIIKFLVETGKMNLTDNFLDLYIRFSQSWEKPNVARFLRKIKKKLKKKKKDNRRWIKNSK